MSDITLARVRRIRILAAIAAAVVIAALTLAPRALVAPLRGQFMRFLDAATEPLLVWIPYGDVERLLNTMLFIPLGVAIALLLSSRAWPLGIFVGFALSAAVEFAQASIPGRVPDLDDVLFNTAGGAIGVALVASTRALARAIRARQRGRTTST